MQCDCSPQNPCVNHKKPDKIQLWEILVPCHKNDGTPYRTRHHRAWDAQVIRVTGGLTIMKPTIGYWQDQRGIGPDGDQNDVYKDRMIPVRIACTSPQINEIIRRTLIHYPDQEAVMAYVISTDVRIIYRDS
jgi:hypothetical protein